VVAYWPLDGDGSDASGNGNDGVMTGMTAAPDRFGNCNKALLVQTTDGAVRVPRLKGAGPSHSISLWTTLSPARTQSNRPFLRIFNNVGGDFIGESANEQIYLDFSTTFSFAPGAPLNWWYFIVLTYDATTTTLSMYEDTALIASSSQATDALLASEIDLGGSQLGTNFSYNGSKIDDVRIFGHALSESEIVALYREGGWNPCADYFSYVSETFTCGCGSGTRLVGGTPPAECPTQPESSSIYFQGLCSATCVCGLGPDGGMSTLWSDSSGIACQ
jgi:hypothetical protein